MALTLRTPIAAAALLLAGCVTTGVPSEVAREIPDGATYLMLLADSMSADDLYLEVYRTLARNGYSFEQENREMGTFKTGFKDVGQGTLVEITCYVEDDDGPIATLRGTATGDAAAGLMAGAVAGTGQDFSGITWPAKWGATGRPGRAFGAMVLAAKEVPGTRISYRMD